MDRGFFRNFKTDISLPVFSPERPDRETDYWGLRCPCGVDVFDLTGWPRNASGRGGLFWRTVARVWREARLPTDAGDWFESPFWLPIVTCCHGCGREETLFDDESVSGRLASGRRAEPKESVRCRVCGRGGVELVVGVARIPDVAQPFSHASAVEVASRCHGCHLQARIAWSRPRRSEQEIQLDLLYGRR